MAADVLLVQEGDVNQSNDQKARLVALAIEFQEIKSKVMIYAQLWKNANDRMLAIVEEVKLIEAMDRKPASESVN